MPRNKKLMIIIAVIFTLALFVISSCTTPIYHHSITHKYDAKGKLIGIEETESITQQDPNAKPMKVKIDHRDKLEN